MWISTRRDRLLCGFCYQAARVLAQNISCAARRQLAGDPDQDAIVVVKVADWPGTHFWLCTSCAELDPRSAGHAS